MLYVWTALQTAFTAGLLVGEALLQHTKRAYVNTTVSMQYACSSVYVMGPAPAATETAGLLVAGGLDSTLFKP
jgi:hypothetical protein